MERIVGGKYVLDKEIGSGSFGKIYLATNQETQEPVAVKLEPLSTRCPQLQYESRLLEYLQGGAGFPLQAWHPTRLILDRTWTPLVERLP